jgi:hypothetical protein
MVDKITIVPKAKVGVRIGRLADEDMVWLNRAVLVFSVIAALPRPRFGVGIDIVAAGALAISREFGKSVDCLLTGEEMR